MNIRDERGIALVLSLFLMAAMSVIAASLMFLSQTETYSSMNYRLMSQARYGAESGVHKATNYILYTYAAPGNVGANGADLLADYDLTKSPVECRVGCPVTAVGPQSAVILSANANQASNYPVAAVQTAFAAAVAGSLPAGTTTTVAFTPYAKLMSMQQIDVYGGGVTTIQTWQIVSTGTITQGRTAQVEVSAIVETPKFPATLYAAFGTDSGCGALNFNSNHTQTDSYDSQAPLVGGKPAISLSGGNVGTNGNLAEGGNADLFGTLASPRVGVGNCSAGNVDALSSGGGATINGHDAQHLAPGDVVQLPQAVTLPPPVVPAGVPTGAFNGDNLIFTNGQSYGDVSVSSGKTLTLFCAAGASCVINVNSLTVNGTGKLAVQGNVTLNVVGAGATDPIKFNGNSEINNSSYAASSFQIMYAGTDQLTLNGGANAVAMLYAPNAAIKLSGNGDFYGSVVGKTIQDVGGAQIHYDSRLSSSFFTVGNAMMSSFSWKKY